MIIKKAICHECNTTCKLEVSYLLILCFLNRKCQLLHAGILTYLQQSEVFTNWKNH